MYLVFFLVFIVIFLKAIPMLLKGGYGKKLDVDFPKIHEIHELSFREKMEEIQSLCDTLNNKYQKKIKLKFIDSNHRQAFTVNYSYYEPCVFIDLEWLNQDMDMVKVIFSHEYYHALKNHSGILARIHSSIVMFFSLIASYAMWFMNNYYPSPKMEPITQSILKFSIIIIATYLFFMTTKLLICVYTRYNELKADLFASKEVNLEAYEKVNKFLTIYYPRDNIRSIFNTHPTANKRLEYVKDKLDEFDCIKIALMLK